MNDTPLLNKFNLPSKFQIIIKENDEYEALFSIGKIDYSYLASNSKGTWYIEFKLLNDVFEEREHEIVNLKSFIFVKKVFSTVWVITQMFINDMKPKKFFFTSDLDERSRVRFYDRFSSEMQNKLKRYDINIYNDNLKRYYVFTKIKSVSRKKK